MSLLRIEVVDASAAGAPRSVQLALPEGATLGDALAAAGLQRPDADAGIWGRRASHDTPLADGDRVELYRPLQVDPKEARRLRAARGGRTKPRPRT